jgi:hypothetical protein
MKGDYSGQKDFTPNPSDSPWTMIKCVFRRYNYFTIIGIVPKMEKCGELIINECSCPQS